MCVNLKRFDQDNQNYKRSSYVYIQYIYVK